jgi:lipopolysaccharide transport system ATP-binding protein
MSNTVIRVEGLSKQYRIGSKRQPYATLRETITNAAGAPVRALRHIRNGPAGRNGHPTFWALRDVNLEVEQGEVLGLIGRNGAGKSTMLKVLSRITDPTGGMAEITGRVGSLLEVGTGFHQELSGRDNIYLNGAILGMKRGEIARKFDEIVAFAEVEEFIDTPVKHYSSGMYLRLAFAVAAHLEPEILLIDEVLAVGDSAFQKKCIGQMGKVAEQGRTVIFVSHNMAAVRALCTRVAYLDHGKLGYVGDPAQAIRCYNNSMASGEQSTYTGGDIGFTDARVNGSAYATIAPGDPFEVSCKLHLRSGVAAFNLCCQVQDGGGENVAVISTDHRRFRNPNQPGAHEITVRFPALWLRTGVYSVFFKLMVSSIGAAAKYVSDNVMLDVLGEHTPTVAFLNPQVEWVARNTGVPQGK